MAPTPPRSDLLLAAADAAAAVTTTTIPPMSALEILRETIRVLRGDPSSFSSILALLILPVSAALLSDFLVPSTAVSALYRHLSLLALRSGLPLSRPVKHLAHHLSSSLLSSLFSLPLLLSLLLLARSSISLSVASVYASRPIHLPDLLPALRRIWPRLALTYLCVCAAVSACLALFIAVLLLACNVFSTIGYPPEIVVYAALVVFVAFSMAYAHTIIVCNLAIVISALEELSGLLALLRSVNLIRGQTQAGLLIFLGSTIGMAFIQGLFEYRVKTLSYGDGSSRIWEGPLLVLMYSFVLLVDSMMSAVFYFACRSSSVELFNGSGHELDEVEKLYSGSTEL